MGEEKKREREVGWAGWAENKGKKKKKNEEGLGRAENEREGKELVFHF